MPTLDEIGLKHRCKQASSHMDYLGFFEELLGHLRDKPIRILELGVLRGESARTWLEYFPKAQVFGIDINLCALVDPRFTAIQADAAAPGIMEAICRQHGPFDVMIDDGPHTLAASQAFMQQFTFLKPGGWLFLEDINIDYEMMRGDGIGALAQSLVPAINHRGLMHYCAKKHWKPGATPFELALRQVILRPGVAALQRYPES